MATEPTTRRIAWGQWLLLLLIVGAIGGAYAWWVNQPREPDMTEIYKANLKGIGLLDYFNYDEAVEAFEEIHKKAPKWIPGRVNLGIALFNFASRLSEEKRQEKLRRAAQLFQDVINEDPENPHAHFSRGMVLKHLSDLDGARAHFKKVTDLDPEDPAAWVEYAEGLEIRSPERLACAIKAFELDPYNLAAIFLYKNELILSDPEKSKHLGDRSEALRERLWYTMHKTAYSALGRNAMPLGVHGKYATPIGAQIDGKAKGPLLPLFDQPKDFQVVLAEGARWAKAEDFGSGPEADLRRAVRKRFGATIVALDYDGDGKTDLFLTGAVVDNGRVRDLLLHNEGNRHLRDVTREMKLADHPASLGAWAADYDNDDFPDLLLTSVDHPRLFRNLASDKNKRGFDDVTKTATLDTVKGVFLGGCLVDLDQDGDLDIVLIRLAATATDALAGLNNAKANGESAPVVFLNTGESLPRPPTEVLALATRFELLQKPSALTEKIPGATNLLISDVDHDRDLDLIVVADAATSSTVILNDRLLTFRRTKLPSLLPAGTWNGGLVLDSRQQEHNDLFFVGPGQPPVLLLNKSKAKTPFAEGFELGSHNSPVLVQARCGDVDLDGRTDVVGLSSERKPVFLHNDGERLVHEPNAFGLDSAFPADGLAVNIVDLDGDLKPDVLFWSEDKGLQWLRNMGTSNNGVQVQLTGRRFNESAMRTNNDAVGAKLRLHAQSLVTGGEISTMYAGLGQSHQPLLLGIGQHKLADIIRIRWPDNVWQGEMSLTAGQLHKIPQENRMPDSCPLLFTWDGEKYAFVCDFLGGGAIGEAMPDRSHRPPRPEESVKIESRQLKAKDGKYTLKLAEPMDEVTYLDRLQLVVVDHPPKARVYPEERMAAAAASQDLHGFLEDEEIYPISARDHKGRDVAKTLRRWDRNMVDGFAKRSWLGYAEDHFVQLDFGEQLAKYGPQDRLFLCLAGWTEYPYPEAMWAANQAGIALTPPMLERQKADGSWETIIPEVGFPAGGSRMIMTEITGKAAGPKCFLRLKTNMRVYWDQIFIAPVKESATSQSVANAPHQGKLFRTTTLSVDKADLTAGHVMQEYSPDGKQPNLYDFHKHQPAPLTRLAGKLTRFGDVTELLQADDDRFVIFGAGDELTVVFAADKLPDLPKGWTRGFVLRTAGYCKSAAPFTATGDTIEPLPFRAMTNFPYGGAERFPQTPLHQEYLRKYQTRQVGGD